jgi:CRP-like cAMP-binding protein
VNISEVPRRRRTILERWRDLGFDATRYAELLIRRFSQLAPLSAEETALVASLASCPQELPAGTELIHEGEPLDRPRLLLAGWACRDRTLPDGRRQIFEFILPGDMFGQSVRPRAMAPANSLALTPVVVADASALRVAIAKQADRYTGLAEACSAMTGLEEAHLFSQLMRVGLQTAYERMAHFILEIHQRLRAVGLAGDTTVAIPLTQEIMADALGLSVVHLNRTLQQLRRDRLLEFKSGIVRLLQPERLAQIANFRAPRVTRPARAAA